MAAKSEKQHLDARCTSYRNSLPAAAVLAPFPEAADCPVSAEGFQPPTHNSQVAMQQQLKRINDAASLAGMH